MKLNEMGKKNKDNRVKPMKNIEIGLTLNIGHYFTLFTSIHLLFITPTFYHYFDCSYEYEPGKLNYL